MFELSLHVETAHVPGPEVLPKIEESGNDAQADSADTDTLIQFSYSDPEADELSDSSSECSFATAIGGHSPFASLDGEDDELRLPPSLLFYIDQPRTAESGLLHAPPPQSFKAALLQHIPEELHGLLHDTCVDYDPFTRSLEIFIGQVPDGQEKGESEPRSYSQDCISSLSIIISELAGVDGMIGRQYQLLLCVLRWAQIRFNNSVEELNIFIPELFPLPKDASYNLENIQAFTRMQTLRLSGDALVLHGLLPHLICPGMRVLKVRSELSVDDALLITRLLDGVQLFAFELGCITGAPSRISPNTVSPSRSLPIALPCLDSIKLTASVSVERLCIALARLTLCKCEFDFSAARAGGEAAIRSVLASPLLGMHILFVDVILEGAFDGMEYVMERIKQKAPFSHASFRKNVSTVCES